MSEPKWLDRDEMRAWRGYVAMSEMLEACLSQDLRKAGLSSADYTVLVLLAEAPDGSLGLGELCTEAQWSKSRVSHQIRRMQGRGLVVREGDESDPRRARAVLTDRGAEALRAAAPVHVNGVRRYLLDHLTPEQQASLADIAISVLPHLSPAPLPPELRPDPSGH
ncbi:MarR family transcriptional regulator [Streptomyces roseoverticillatus]|uniref:MarR family winged helix-turn-helix transcriptional regulator n=1 Tax=Streptomyces roseoverticillatus TaxID=66429 RepID=UPI001F21816F|nr:MarR family transcriptional regulator [Streptomyces roseoverticillatus]MCF3106119.1 MarR family transcriptional regulator [Streptomyces roseoverticillatus]